MDIATIRSGLSLTQAQLADKLGISPGHMGDLERGHRRLTIELAAKLEALTDRSDIVAAVVAQRTQDAA